MSPRLRQLEELLVIRESQGTMPIVDHSCTHQTSVTFDVRHMHSNTQSFQFGEKINQLETYNFIDSNATELTLVVND